jgi:hypothetical protein
MKKNILLFLFAASSMIACQSGGSSAPGEGESAPETSGTTQSSSPSADPEFERKLVPSPGTKASQEAIAREIEAVYEAALPFMPFQESFQLTKNGDCLYSFSLAYTDQEKVLYEVDFSGVDLDKMNVFMDENDFPGIRLQPAEGEEAIRANSNNKGFGPEEEMVLKMDDRKNAAKLVFALRDLIKKCQEAAGE